MFRVVARDSKLSLAQVKEVFILLPNSIEYEIKLIKSYGDKHKEIPLTANIPEDFFTREIDNALLNKEADIAIHSAKDLPFPLPEGLTLLALTEGKTSSDALVSKNKRTLLELHPGSKIGVSSHLRINNILSVRKDLNIVTIRGNIEERLAYIENGKLDAIIVALCALERLGLQDRVAEILSFKTHPLQGKLAVVGREKEPEFASFFYPIDVRKNYGKVYLVGAGPGDERLLTIKAIKCITYADVILYDDLINREILKFNNKAEKIYIGKRNNHHHKSQDEINELLYQFALEGKTIVRLKGGEPLLFGRAQEEIDFLLRRFINVEIISGISSVFAAFSSLLLSSTHRNEGSKIIIESGHMKTRSHNENISSYTFLMGSSSKMEIKEKLILKRISKDSKVLLVQNASLPEEKIVETNLYELDTIKFTSPLVIIAGNITKYFVKQHKILYTGKNEFESLSMLPGRLIYYPLIKVERIRPLPDINIFSYSAIIFTSTSAVKFFTEYYGVQKNKNIYAIGIKTKELLLKYGYDQVLIPERFNSYALYNLLKIKESNGKILYPGSDISKNVLQNLNNITFIPVYKTCFVKQKEIDLEEFDAVYFASPSCVDAFLRIYGKIPKHLVLYASGKKTYEKLVSIGEEKRSIETVKKGEISDV